MCFFPLFIFVVVWRCLQPAVRAMYDVIIDVNLTSNLFSTSTSISLLVHPYI